MFGFHTRSVRGEDAKTRTSPGDGLGAGVMPLPRTDFLLNQETALSIGAVYRCVSIISNTISQLPLIVRRGDEEVTTSLARRPDVNTNTNDFWGSTATSLALTGNAYWWVSRNQDGEVKNLEVLNPRNVIVNREDRVGAPITYDYNGKRVNKKNIKHIKLMVLPGGIKGVGPLQAGRDDIENAKRLLLYSNSFLENGGIPTGVLSSDQYLNQEQADAYRSAWNEAQDTRGLAVLGAGLSYAPISLTPEDLMLLENQKFSTLQIARLFGIPPIFLGAGIEGSSLTYATTETLGILFLQTTLSEYLVSIEEAFTDLLPRGQKGTFRLDSLTRSDLKTRVDAYSNLIDKQVLTPTEVRLLEGYGPEPVGDLFDQAPIQTPQERGQEETNE
jgi:HK97 family phage portal protein